MEERLKKVFQKDLLVPEGDFNENIWQAILTKEETRLKLRSWSFVAFGLVSLFALVPAMLTLFKDFTASGFYAYLSLAFHSSSLPVYWRELVLSLVESLPLYSLVLSLSLIFAVLLSLHYLARTMDRDAVLHSILQN